MVDPNSLPPPTDLGAVNLAKSIRTVESNGNFQAQGKSGESGAYQFMPKTWQSYAGKYLGDPNAEMTKENQNFVAYSKIKELKDQGFSPDQVASIWNSGKPDYQGNVGVNSQGVGFNTPKYVISVMNKYQQFRQGVENGTTLPNPSQVTDQTQQQKSLGGFVGNIFSSGANLVGGLANIFLHPIQTVQGIGQAIAHPIQNVVNPLKERYGGLSNIANTLYNDPVGAALDVSTVLGGVGALGKIGAEGSNLARLGEMAAKGSEIIDPIQGALKLSQGALTKTLGKAGTTAENIYQNTLKPSMALQEKFPNLIQSGLQRGIPITEKGLSGIEQTLTDLRKGVKELTANSSGTIDNQAIINYLQRSKQLWKGTSVETEASQKIDQIAQDFLKQQGETSTVAQAQTVKEARQFENRKRYGDIGAIGSEANKDIAYGIRKEIEKQIPEVGKLNQKSIEFQGLNKAITKALQRIGNKNTIGLTDIGAGILGATATGPMGALAGVATHIFRDPGVQSRLAIALYKLSKTQPYILGLYKPGLGGILNQLNTIVKQNQTTP